MEQIDNPARLFARFGYDATLEATAFERLEQGDRSGCRSALCELAQQLRPNGSDAECAFVIQLLADVLHRANRRLHLHPTEETRYQAERLEIIKIFSGCEALEPARRRFLGVVNRLLVGNRNAPQPSHPQVLRAMTLIEDHYEQRLSLSSVAERLAVSPSYLSRLFRRETGMTLTSYLQRIRLRHAVALLADERRSCSEIAYQVGYQNYRDFYRNVVKYERAAPRQIRRRLNGRLRGSE